MSEAMTGGLSKAGDLNAPLPFQSKFCYGIGQYAEGIANASMTSLMFFYYSQVLGLSASLVGLALLLAGLTDGILDAFVGLWSDATRHRWGRRHPYIYASAIPMGVTLTLVYIPPASLTNGALFAWLFVWAFAVRAASTCFMIPHWALGAELTKNFHERTTIVAFRSFFSYIGTASVFFLSVFIFRTAGTGDALIDPAPYRILGWVLGIVSALVILASAWGTHSCIPRLPQPSESDEKATIGNILKEVAGLFRNRAFRIFFVAANLFALALIQSRVLDLFMGKYFWRFSSEEVLLLPGLSILGFASGTLFWARISRKIGKKTAYITGILGYTVGTVGLPLLKIAGLLPGNDSPLYFPMVAGVGFLSLVSAAAGGVLAGSVLADVAEDYQRETAKKKAGLIAGSLVFCNKAMAGLSQLFTGIILSIIGVQTRAPAGSVTVATSTELALFYVFICGAGGIGFALVFRRYPIGDKSRRQ